MYLLDDSDQLVDAECSLDVLDGDNCIVVASSGGGNPAREVKCRNPDYNKLLYLIFRRLAENDIHLKKVVLDSAKVAQLPINDRIATLDYSYPIDLNSVDIDIEEFRKHVQAVIATMHRAPNAKKGGNPQKRIRICLSHPISPDLLVSKKESTKSSKKAREHTPGLSKTERDYIQKSRLGQGQFRKDLFDIFDGVCQITGISNSDLLVASHIKPWKVCSNRERLDEKNGILLSALIDRLFDRGLITFNDDGEIVVSP